MRLESVIEGMWLHPSDKIIQAWQYYITFRKSFSQGTLVLDVHQYEIMKLRKQSVFIGLNHSMNLEINLLWVWEYCVTFRECPFQEALICFCEYAWWYRKSWIIHSWIFGLNSVRTPWSYCCVECWGGEKWLWFCNLEYGWVLDGASWICMRV